MPPTPNPGRNLEVRVRSGLGAVVDRAALRRIVGAILEREGLPPETRVTLTVVGERAIHRLNREFRATDRPTDVLSFPLQTEGFALPPGEPPHIGDVVLCWPVAVRQAAEYGHSVERETAYLFTHGVLHLLGYDHEEPEEQRVMRAREEETLATVGLTR